MPGVSIYLLLLFLAHALFISFDESGYGTVKHQICSFQITNITDIFFSHVLKMDGLWQFKKDKFTILMMQKKIWDVGDCHLMGNSDPVLVHGALELMYNLSFKTIRKK